MLRWQKVKKTLCAASFSYCSLGEPSRTSHTQTQSLLLRFLGNDSTWDRRIGQYLGLNTREFFLSKHTPVIPLWSQHPYQSLPCSQRSLSGQLPTSRTCLHPRTLQQELAFSNWHFPSTTTKGLLIFLWLNDIQFAPCPPAVLIFSNFWTFSTI